MLCIDVIVNGERRTTAGIDSAESIEAVVVIYPEQKIASLTVSGDVLPPNQPPADAQWATATLSVGDKVELQVVDSDQPVAPALNRIDTTLPATDEIPFVCAICRKDAHQVESMISSGRIMICRGCIVDLYELVSKER